MSNLCDQLRQYRHNDDSGFVTAYEREGTEKLVTQLMDEIRILRGTPKLTSMEITSEPLITKREHIAIGAMKAILSNHSVVKIHNRDCINWISQHAIHQADDLLKELDK